MEIKKERENEKRREYNASQAHKGASAAERRKALQEELKKKNELKTKIEEKDFILIDENYQINEKLTYYPFEEAFLSQEVYDEDIEYGICIRGNKKTHFYSQNRRNKNGSSFWRGCEYTFECKWSRPKKTSNCDILF